MATRLLNTQRIVNLASNPASAAAGEIYYNTGENKLKFYNGTSWTDFGGGSGTVTSVGVSVPTGLSVANSPVTTSGTIAISLASGYTIPTTAALDAKAPLVSPTFTTPNIGVATGTSFNSITGLSSTNPAMNGTAAVGTGTTVARADHVHPTDTSRAPLASPALTGTPTSTTAAVDTNTTQIATTAFVLGQASASNPLALGSVAQGTSTRYARQDHVHPTTGLGLTSGTLGQFAATTSSQLAGVISDETGSGLLVFGTGPTLSQPIIDNPRLGYTTVATAAGTTTLTATSSMQQFFTGTSTQTVLLPVTSTLALGQAYIIHNNSTGNVTVQSSGANTIYAVPGGVSVQFTCILTSGTTAASWDFEIVGANTLSGTGSIAFTASPALTGTPTAPTAAVDTNTTQVATTAFVLAQASGANPLALGTVAQGTSTRYARQDHVHPTTGLGLTSGKLSQFAATTSAELAGVISDETGSGALVFGTSPSFTTLVTINGGSTADANPELTINGVSGYIHFHNALSAGAYNPNTALNDKGIIFTNGSVDTGSFMIAPWSNTSGGLKIDGTGRTTFANTIFTSATTATRAGINIPHGTAPTSPTNGDVWTTTSGLFARINGGTVGPYGIGTARTFYQTTAPSSPTTGDVWVDSDEVYTAINPNDYMLKSEIDNYVLNAFFLSGLIA